MARRKRQQRRPLPIFLTWLSAVGGVALVTTAWWTGKPLTIDMQIVIGIFLSWSLKMDVSWARRLADHTRAVKEIAESKGVPNAQVETIYAVVEDEVETEQRRRRRLPRGREK